ncbi:MAG: type II toxin-antitoxin system VapC family toxin [Lentisphaerae bacterium]|nr:type II toxin-antitoxin system VapC family toxin [Lentisphaerota bacterium]
MGAFRDLCQSTPRMGCRTLDILHVACALQLKPTEFLTFDHRQRKLAAHAGLKVAALAG